MPGIRLNANKADYKILTSFFVDKNNKKFTPSLKLGEEWRTTQETKQVIKDKSSNPKKRLEKLTSFGLLDHEIIDYKGRLDNYWYITLEGIYVLLAKLNKKDVNSFLKANQKILPDFLFLEKSILNNELRIRYFLSQIRILVKNYQYYLLENFIKKWFKDNYGTRARVKLWQPDLKTTLKKVYNHDPDFLKELQKQYGR